MSDRLGTYCDDGTTSNIGAAKRLVENVKNGPSTGCCPLVPVSVSGMASSRNLEIQSSRDN